MTQTECPNRAQGAAPDASTPTHESAAAGPLDCDISQRRPVTCLARSTMAWSALLLLSVGIAAGSTVTISNVLPRRSLDGSIMDAHDGSIMYDEASKVSRGGNAHRNSVSERRRMFVFRSCSCTFGQPHRMGTVRNPRGRRDGAWPDWLLCRALVTTKPPTRTRPLRFAALVLPPGLAAS
jgi:hypothetical protein